MVITNLVSTVLISALISVESGYNDMAVGDGGSAFGCLQITQRCVDDVNRILGRREFCHLDAFDHTKAVEMASIYLKHYGLCYTRASGRTASPEILARIWNGGPNAWKPKERRKTNRYWAKVLRHLKKSNKPH